MFVELGLRERTEESYMKKQKRKAWENDNKHEDLCPNGPENRRMACGEHSSQHSRHQRDQRGSLQKGQNRWRELPGPLPAKGSDLESWDPVGEWAALQAGQGRGNWWRSTARNMPETWCHNCATRKAIYRTEAIKNAKFMWRKWEADKGAWIKENMKKKQVSQGKVVF